MQKLSIPLNGLKINEDQPQEKVGSLNRCDNWLKWKSMLKQPTGAQNLVAATAVHSAIWYRDSNNNASIIYTDGRDIKAVTEALNASTITANEFAANAGTARWPIDRFYKHIMFGSDHDGMHWYYPPGYSGTVTGKAGVTAPANAATGASSANANGLTGVYQLVYTYVNALNHESGPSPASASVCVYDHPIDWSNIAVGPTGTTSRKLYRTVNDGALFLYLTSLNDNTTTTYADSTLDTALGSEVNFDNSDVPPTTIRGMCVAGSRLYLLDDASIIWACKIDPDTALPNWEAFPTSLSCTIPAGEGSDKVQNIFSLNEVVFAATRSRTFRLNGDPYTGQQVTKVAEVGMFNRYSWCYLIDSDERYVAMLTSNLKVVQMDQSGNWKELGQDLITAFQSLSNFKSPDLGDSIDMLHDTRLNIITMHCATSGTANHTTYVLDLHTGKWSKVDWGYMLSLMDDTNQHYIGYEKGSRLVWHNSTYFRKDEAAATYFNNQTFQTYPFSIPDKQLSVGRIGLVVRALPIVSYIPPMLQVEYALDNNDRWTSTLVDVSNAKRRIGGSGNSLVAQEAVTVYVPVHRTVSSISVRVTAPKNAAAIQGFEIYDLFLEVEEAEEAPSESRDIDRDKR